MESNIYIFNKMLLPKQKNITEREIITNCLRKGLFELIEERLEDLLTKCDDFIGLMSYAGLHQH